MPTPTKGPRIGSSPTHERAIMNGLATELFRHGKITTTQTRAKRVQPLAEQLITTAKKGLVEGGNELAARRRVIRRIEDREVVHILFTQIAPGFAERPGGCTRVIKIGERRGDNAPMAVIELVTEEYSPKQAVVKEAEGAAKGAAKTEAADETAATEETADEAVTEETAAEDTSATEAAADDTAADDASEESAEEK